MSSRAELIRVFSKARIAAFANRNPFLHAYELGDLDDFFWPHTTWYGLEEEGELTQLALVYGEPEVPILLALAEPPVERMSDLLRELTPILPARTYAHLRPESVSAVEGRYRVESRGLHLKMGLLEPNRLDGSTGAEPTPVTERDLPEIERLYREAYPDTWFAPRMLASGRYVGVREQGRLVAIAGVHVYSPYYRVAALGNVATHPSARGRGLATAACACLCRLLLDDGVETIALNVRADNGAAIRAYEKLGFGVVAEYVEVMLEAGS